MIFATFRKTDFKFSVVVVVDIQTLIMLVQPGIRQCGIEFCTQYIWGDDMDKIEDKARPRPSTRTSSG